MKQLIVHICLAIIIFFISGVAKSFQTARERACIPSPPSILTPVAKPSELRPQVTANVFTPELVCNYDPKKINPRGVYYMLGRKPKGFRDFHSLQLAVDHVRPSGDAEIQTYSDYQQFIGLVTSKSVKLISLPISEESFEYSFEGHFLKSGVLSDARGREAVLRGKLTKSKGGVKVAECEVNFRVEYLGC